MGDRGELIVEFHDSVTEDEARALVESLGAQVRRKMRGDVLTLLVRLSSAQRSAFDASPKVRRTEPNDDSYGVQ